MISNEINVEIKSNILADILREKAELIEQSWEPYGNISPAYVTVDNDEIKIIKNGAEEDFDLFPCPERISDFVFFLIKLFGGYDGEDIINDLTSQKESGTEPNDYDMERYGQIGQLYKELCIREQAIINDLKSVVWESNNENSDEGEWGIYKFTYDPINGEHYEVEEY